MYMLNKTNKCQINIKNVKKIFLMFFYILTKNNKSESKRKKSKMIKKSHNGPRGCMCEKGVQTEK